MSTNWADVIGGSIGDTIGRAIARSEIKKKYGEEYLPKQSEGNGQIETIMRLAKAGKQLYDLWTEEES